MEHAPANRYRELAEAHFKLGLAFEYSEQNEESIEQIGCAMAVLQTKLDALEASAGGKGKQVVTDDSIESDDEEIKMLKGFLSELGSKVSFVHSFYSSGGFRIPLFLLLFFITHYLHI